MICIEGMEQRIYESGIFLWLLLQPSKPDDAGSIPAARSRDFLSNENIITS